MNYDIFRKNLKIVRRSSNMTAVELSKELDFRQQKRIADIEDGRGKLTLSEVCTICEFFEIQIDGMLNKHIQVEFIFN